MQCIVKLEDVWNLQISSLPLLSQTANDGADSVRAPRLSFRNSPNTSLLMTADNCSARYVAHSCLSANTAVPRFCPRGLHSGVQCTCSARDLGIVPINDNKPVAAVATRWREKSDRREPRRCACRTLRQSQFAFSDSSRFETAQVWRRSVRATARSPETNIKSLLVVDSRRRASKKRARGERSTRRNCLQIAPPKIRRGLFPSSKECITVHTVGQRKEQYTH